MRLKCVHFHMFDLLCVRALGQHLCVLDVCQWQEAFLVNHRTCSLAVFCQHLVESCEEADAFWKESAKGADNFIAY